MLEEETGCWTLREEMLAFGMKIEVVERQLRTRERRIAKLNQDEDDKIKKAKDQLLAFDYHHYHHYGFCYHYFGFCYHYPRIKNIVGIWFSILLLLSQQTGEGCKGKCEGEGNCKFCKDNRSRRTREGIFNI